MIEGIRSGLIEVLDISYTSVSTPPEDILILILMGFLVLIACCFLILGLVRAIQL